MSCDQELGAFIAMNKELAFISSELSKVAAVVDELEKEMLEFISGGAAMDSSKIRKLQSVDLISQKIVDIAGFSLSCSNLSGRELDRRKLVDSMTLSELNDSYKRFIGVLCTHSENERKSEIDFF